MNRDMTGFRIIFKPCHHRPAVDAGQADIQDDGAGLQQALEKLTEVGADCVPLLLELLADDQQINLCL